MLTYYYNIKYDNGTKGLIFSKKKLKKNTIVHDINGRKAVINNEAKLRYTIEDLKTLANILYKYDSGTEQVKLGNKVISIIKTNIPTVRFSAKERDIIGEILDNEEKLSDDDRNVLNKIMRFGK